MYPWLEDMPFASQPTQVLYERARMAASAKSSPTSRKSGLPSQRRLRLVGEDLADAAIRARS
jgi:hypothetical protein